MIISVLIGILIVIVVGAICFWAIDKFAPDQQICSSCSWCSFALARLCNECCR